MVAVSTDVTDATFSTAVLERSAQVPVVVDVWAPWCGPCTALGPIIERVVDATGGRVELVKVNADENPQISAAFKVQSIPAVFALRDAKVVSSFVGARGEAEVQAFIDDLLPSEAEERLASLVAAGDEDSLRQALELEPGHDGAVLALARLLAGDGRGDEALTLLEPILPQQLFAPIPEPRFGEPFEDAHVAALARQGGVDGDDVEARLGALLDRVKDDEAARKEFVDLLELLGPDDERTPRWRKELTARLF